MFLPISARSSSIQVASCWAWVFTAFREVRAVLIWVASVWIEARMRNYGRISTKVISVVTGAGPSKGRTVQDAALD